MLRWLAFLKSVDGDDAFHMGVLGKVQGLHGAIFTYVESLLVLAAIQLAVVQASSSWELWLIFFAAYGAQLFLTSIYFQTGAKMLLGRLPLRGRKKDIALWGVGLLALGFNIWLVGALSAVLRRVVETGLAALA